MSEELITPAAAESGNLHAAVPQVERYVRDRRNTNQVFVSWAIYYFLLSWATFGIYTLILFYKRINRSDLYRDRKLGYYTATINLTRQVAQNKGDTVVLGQLADLEQHVNHRFAQEHKKINAGLSLVLAIVTLTIYGYYAVYREMRFWWQIQLTEQDFYDRIGATWTKLGIVKYPVACSPVAALNRSFWMHLGLTIITLGIYGLVWDYHLHTDPEKVYPESDSAEDGMLAAIRQLAV